MIIVNEEKYEKRDNVWYHLSDDEQQEIVVDDIPTCNSLDDIQKINDDIRPLLDYLTFEWKDKI